MGIFCNFHDLNCWSSQPNESDIITKFYSNNNKSKNKNISINNKINNIKNSIKSYEFDDFKEKIIKLHNDLRKKYCCKMLKENNILNNIAEDYANKLILKEKNYSFNNNIYHNINVGENIAITNSHNPEEIFKMWADEEINYEFKQNCSTKTNHFTQIIWKETTDIGIGFSYDLLSGQYCTVILYYPIGNSLRDFSKNLSVKTETEIDFDK